MRRSRWIGGSAIALSAAAAVASCSSGITERGTPTLIEGLKACPGPTAGRACATYRGIAGISMGGGSAMRIALERPTLFDVAVSLGSPYIDLEYFLLSVGKVSNGGFCAREQLLGNLDVIDAKDDPRTWCGPVAFDDLALPGTSCGGFSGDYNHHYRGPSAGRGGSFDREGSFEIVHDFALAYGNPAFYNAESPYLPPGVGARYHVPLELSSRDRAGELNAYRARLCADPATLVGFVDRTYNPTGEYPVITYCDGNGSKNGEYDPGVTTFPVEVTLAADYNRNGRRDYGEPTLSQPFEPYDDFGEDGRPSAREPGYDRAANPDPAGDDYHWLENPAGSEGNFRHDPMERFEDAGLDGVAGTGDFGEGNARFDANPNIERTFSRSPRHLVESLDQETLDRLHIWVDAGIRDFLFSSQITNQFFGALSARAPGARLFTDWSGLGQVAGPAGKSYDPRLADLSPEAVGRHAYLRYGDPSVCPGVDEDSGRGNHVGSAREVLDRIMTAFAFASARFPNGDHAALPGGIGEQGSPNAALEDFVLVRDFESEAIGRPLQYVVVLPPDYYRAPSARYPVVYFLHGQGQKATDLAASALLLLSPEMSSDDVERQKRRRSDWQKMIIVFADGECQVGECHTGTFYIDHRGVDGNGPRFGEAFFELMRVIDASFRTKEPEML